jgi:hypothetical protein
MAELLVQSPQPTCNPNPTPNQKQLFLPKLFIDEVVGLAFLLLKIRKIFSESPPNTQLLAENPSTSKQPKPTHFKPCLHIEA